MSNDYTFYTIVHLYKETTKQEWTTPAINKVIKQNHILNPKAVGNTQ